MTPTFSTYVTTWDRDPYQQIQEMINKNVITENTRIILAFASFNFSSTTYIPGFGSLTIQQVQAITGLVHGIKAKISLSIGGATYPLTGSDLYTQPGVLASNINTMLKMCDFDGVDFDIEDASTIVPSNFAVTAASIINTLRSINTSVYITLTTAAQAWSSTNYQQYLLNLTIGSINAWQPMEYDIWINPTCYLSKRTGKSQWLLDPSSAYPDQIQWDINYYLTTWGVPANKIILGLMPGTDDTGQVLTLQNALNLTTFVQINELQGVMTWDANIDSKGCDGNAPYAYCMGIQSMLTMNPPRLIK